jgi:RHS repeat-associated protein
MVYIGGIFEKNLDTGEVTKYYHTADGRRLAMRKVPSSGPTTLSYFANDHLGGTAVVMNDQGGLVSRVRYLPYGNQWTQETGAPPTDRLFTGQRRYGAKSGVYDYGARFYSADIGRFLSPDSIVPEPDNPQALNRYSYVLNNPLGYSDPSGHKPERGCTMSTCGYKPAPRRGPVHTVPLPPRPRGFSSCRCPLVVPTGGVYGEAGTAAVWVAAPAAIPAILTNPWTYVAIGGAVGCYLYCDDVFDGVKDIGPNTWFSDGGGDGIEPQAEDIERIEEHLRRVAGEQGLEGLTPEDEAMLERLGQALREGGALEGADEAYYQHELKEEALRTSGMEQGEAHEKALEDLGHGSYDLYHPDVIERFPQRFNQNWRDYWGIR